MAWVYFVGDTPANNTHISSILSIATFISGPVHLLGCHVGRLAAKCSLIMPAGSARQFGTASARGGLSRGCMAQLVFVPFLMGILEVGATPRRSSSSSTAATAHAVPQNGLSLVAVASSSSLTLPIRRLPRSVR